MSGAPASLFRSDPALLRIAFRTPAGFLALGFGSGLFRYAPGTAGTVVAAPLAIALASLPPALAAVIVAGLFTAGIPLCGAAARALGDGDPGAIVWDEMVGFCLVILLLPPGWTWWLAAFAGFRLFDILKPWPIRLLERRAGGGLGIMIDDLVAALYTAALLRLIEWAS